MPSILLHYLDLIVTKYYICSHQNFKTIYLIIIGSITGLQSNYKKCIDMDTILLFVYDVLIKLLANQWFDSNGKVAPNFGWITKNEFVVGIFIEMVLIGLYLASKSKLSHPFPLNIYHIL